VLQAASHRPQRLCSDSGSLSTKALGAEAHLWVAR
jgi:hypothetical protein